MSTAHHDPIPDALLAKLEQRSYGRPDIERLVERLKQRREAAPTDHDREQIDKMLVSTAYPYRNAWRIGIPIVFVVLGAFTLSSVLESRHQQAIDDGIPAIARILRSERGHCWFGTSTTTCTAITLELHTEGKPPSITTVTERVPKLQLARVAPGAWVEVAVDAKDPTRVMLDLEALSGLPPTPRTP